MSSSHSWFRWLRGRPGRAAARRPWRDRRADRLRARLALEELGARVLPAVNTWINLGGGSWQVAANWSLGHVPTVTEDAVIPDLAGSQTVVYGSGASSVASLSSAENVTLSGGMLAVSGAAQVGGTFQLAGGTLSGATLASGTTLVLTRDGGTLSGVTVAAGASLDGTQPQPFGGNPTATVAGGLTLDGAANLGNTTGTAAGQLYFSGAQTLGGTGTVTFGTATANTNALYVTGGFGSSALLTVGAGITVQGGRGTVGAAGIFGSTVSVLNRGTLRVGAGGALTISGTDWSNAGVIDAAAGSTVNLGGTLTTAALGDFRAAGATVNLTGALDNTDAALPLAASDTWFLRGGTLAGGTVGSGGTLVLTDSGGTLAGVTVAAGATIDGTRPQQFGNRASATVTGELTLNGTANLGNAAGTSAGRLTFQGTQTLDGGGTVMFGGSANNGLLVSGGASVLTIGPAVTIRGGSGSIAAANTFGSDTFVNQGTIDVGPGGTLTLGGTNWANAGTIAADGATVNLGGAVTTAGLGDFQADGGTVNLTGTVNNANAVLPLAASTGTWFLRGGAINGGTVGSDGSALVLTRDGGTLSGVAVAAGAVLDGAQVQPFGSAATATVTGGLTLDGEARLGNAAGTAAGRLTFQGTQTLAGRGAVTFGSSANNGLLVSGGASVLTIGPAVTIRGGSGSIAAANTFGSDTFVNQGTIDIAVGQTLTLGGTNWSSLGTITAGGATVNLGGSLATAALGDFRATGATVNLTGTVNNAGNTLTLGAATGGSWRLTGGTLRDGVLESVDGSALVLTRDGGTLSGVAVAAGAVLDGAQVQPFGSAATATVTGGLTLDGEARLGNAAGTAAGRLTFQGTQTLAGRGAVTFGSSANNGLLVSGGASVLTIGPAVTIRGGSGSIAAANTFGSDTFVNQGAIDVGPGGTFGFSPGLRIDGTSRVSVADAATVQIAGNLLGDTANPVLFRPRGMVNVSGGTAASPRLLEAMSRDQGAAAAGFANNFAFGSLVLAANTYVRLVDQSDNAAGAGGEVLYADSIVIPAGSTLDLNGLTAYARTLQQNGAVVNGTVTVLPDSGPLALGTATAGTISPAGQLDEWTFFGRADSSITVRVNPGTATIPAPVSPPLNWARVRLLGPDGSLLAAAASATAGAAVFLSDIALPADGVYKVRIDAAPGHAANTGNYVLTAWDTTPTVRPLVPNETATGTLATPFAVDRWTFAATAGEQVRFDLLGTSAAGLTFSLAGPNGYAGFTDLTDDSSLLTLPADGTYTLTVRGPTGATGGYAFVVRQTTVTDLTLGTPFTGTLVASGQPQLFRVEVPAAQVLSVELSDAATGGRTELYARFGAPPTRETYDHAATGPGRSQSLFVPSATPGTWYVLVYGESVPQPGGYALTARGSAAKITAVTPDRAGNAAPTLVTVTGAGFTPGTTVELVASNGTTTYAPTSFTIDLYTQITATFAAGLPADTYAVRVNNAGYSDTLANAVRVTAGGQARLETNLILPTALGRHAVATLYVEFANTGDLAMAAPLLSLQSADPDGSDRPVFTLDQNRIVENFWSSGLPPGTGNSVLILGSGAQPGVLNPGERVRVPVYFLGLQQPWDFGDTAVELEVRYWTEDDATAIDWASRQEALRPPLLGADQWAAVYDNLTGGLATTGDYVTMLNQNARYLAQLGENVTGVDDLWNFEVQQAYGYTAVPTLDSAVDAAMPTPGVSLDFARRFGNAIQSRYADGPLGRGWFTPWQTKLVSTDGGNLVQVVGEGGSARTFQRDSRNGGYFSGTGDSATLTAVGGGAFELRAVSGTVTRFRADGRIESVRDANGNKVTAEYDAGGRLTSLTHTSGASLALAYTAAGRIGSVTDSAGRTTTYGYDATDTYLTSVTTADGKVTRYTYQTAGAVQVKNALLSIERGGTTQFFDYDARGRLDASYLTGNAQFVDYSYSDTGLVTVADAAGTTSLFFDHNGLLAKVTDPLGFITSNEFDTALRLNKTVGPTGESQSFTWSGRGSLASVTNELGQTTSFAYANPLGRMTSFIDAKGQRTDYTYDSKGNLLTTVYPNGSVERLGNYSAAGLPGVSTNRRGQALSYTYNVAGQVTRQTFADGTFITFGYDTRGNLTTATDGTEVTTYDYSYATDGDRLSRVTYLTGRYLDYDYDSFGRRIGMTDQDGYATKYEYDSAGRLYRLRDTADMILVTYSYDASGRLSRVDKGNDTFTTYDYDAAGQLLSLKNWRDATTLNSRFEYTYDARGRRVTMATLDGTWTYGYDGTGQLTRAVFASLDTSAIPNQDLQYFYDAAGNRTKTVINGVTTLYTANSLNQYTTVGGVGQTYDADGNLTFDGVNTYAWDQQSRLVRVSGPQGVTEYEYDAFGNRTAKVENGVRTEYLIDGLATITITADYSSDGVAQYRYVNGLGLISQQATNSHADYFEFDVNGSVTGLTSNNGDLVYRNLYDPFGTRLIQPSLELSRFGFMGSFGVSIGPSNHTLLTRNRLLNTETGRFYSTDPFRLEGGLNLYNYALNNPIDYVDPSGNVAVLAVPVALLIGSTLVAASETVTFSAGFHLPISAGTQIGQAGTISWKRSTDDLDVGYAQDWQFGGIADIGFNLEFNRGIEANAGSVSFGLPSKFNAGKYGTGITVGFAKGRFIPVSIALGVGLGVSLPVTFSAPIPANGESDGNETASTVGSFDPNQKLPGNGFGPQAFVAGNAATPYRIDFENYETATAPAQYVTVSDFLSADFDWNTFRLTEIGWGDIRLTVPPNSQSYRTTVRMMLDGKAFDVLVEAGIRTATGEVYASFQSLDPASQLPPDVLTGFLPAEDGTGRGMGHVSYTVRPKAALPTGTEIRNVALISFDQQLAIATDQVDPLDPTQGIDTDKQARITIDAAPPTSAVAVLPATTATAAFTVAWSGSDDAGGSGVAGYDVYVSTNNGPYTRWLTNTPDTSATFTGQDGHTYRFYSVATDNTGQRQPTPSAAQATTTVHIEAPTSAVAALPVFTTTAAFTVSWSGSVGASGSSVAEFKVYVSDNGGAFTLWHQSATAGSAAFTGQDGHTYGFYSVATDDAGNVQPTPAAAQATTLVDLAAPTSAVAALPAVTATAAFTLNWSGTDGANGAGVATYDVYVSADGGPFVPFVTNTAQTGGAFVGQDGHTYGFYSVATDNAGLRQPTPSAAQATTRVDTSTAAPPGGGTPPGTTPPVTGTPGAPSAVIVPRPDFVLTADGGTVRRLTPARALAHSFTPFAGFAGEVRVASGDVDRDGVYDTIAVVGGGGAAHVKVFSGATGAEIRSFYAFDPRFLGGASVAAGDVDGDGYADIVVAAGPGGGSHVKVFSGATGGELLSFLAYPGYSGPVFVAAADLDADGRADVVTSTGAGGRPHVKAFSGATGATLRSFFAFDAGFVGGVYVAAGDVDGDGRADIITGSGDGARPHVKVFSGSTGDELASYFAYAPGFLGGVRVSAQDVDGDGRADIVVGSGPGARAHLKAFRGGTYEELESYLVGDAGFTGGIWVS